MTILFREDWEKYPNAIIDTKTKNTSFIRLAALYKEMGIKNHAFLLQLHNQELQGLDPFDPNLSLEQMAMIAIECKQNFFYYIREIARVPGGTQSNPILFKANRGNIALYWLFFNHVTLILVQPRQTGKSFSTDELMEYLLNIRCTDTQINLLTKDDTIRSANLERLKNIEFELPFYLKQRGRGDIGNTEELTVKSLGNSYRGHLPNKSPKLALNVGRGLTSPIFQCDESAYFHNVGISLPAALSAGTAARALAKSKGDPYGTILTTTAGKKDDRDGAYVYNLLINSAVWTELFLDAANEEELYYLIRKNSPKGELRVNCTFSHRQLGYTDEWLKEVMEASLNEGESAERDYLNVWTAGSQLSPLPVNLTTMIRESQVTEYYNEISSPYGYITRWYIPESSIEQYMANNETVLSIDSSDAAGGDDIALTLRSIKTGELIAAGNYNETNLITFSEWLVSWIVKYLKLTLIIERRSTGAMILDYLLLLLPSKNIDPFARIYNKVVQEHDEYPDRYKEINKPLYMRSQEIYVKYKKQFGFATSGTGVTSRTDLYSTTLINAAKITGDKVKDVKTIDQILGLVIKNGRVDHADGGHDDMVISWLLSFWLLTQGKNLNYYGINSRDILVDSKYNRETNTPLARYEHQQQNYLRQQIESLVEELKKEKDEFVSMKLEHKLKLIASDLSDADKQILAVDDLVNSLREYRKMNNLNKTRYY